MSRQVQNQWAEFIVSPWSSFFREKTLRNLWKNFPPFRLSPFSPALPLPLCDYHFPFTWIKFWPDRDVSAQYLESPAWAHLSRPCRALTSLMKTQLPGCLFSSTLLTRRESWAQPVCNKRLFRPDLGGRDVWLPPARVLGLAISQKELQNKMWTPLLCFFFFFPLRLVRWRWFWRADVTPGGEYYSECLMVAPRTENLSFNVDSKTEESRRLNLVKYQEVYK